MHSMDEVEFPPQYSPAPLKERSTQSPKLSSIIDMNSTVNSKVNEEEPNDIHWMGILSLTASILALLLIISVGLEILRRKGKAAQLQALIDAWEKKKKTNLRPINSQQETDRRTSVNVHECLDETELAQELSVQSWNGREESSVESESNGSQELNSEENDGVISIVNDDVEDESEDDGTDEDSTD